MLSRMAPTEKMNMMCKGTEARNSLVVWVKN